jgi:transglutaminase-like putative cysteine protease
MQYQIKHVTAYRYSEPVRESQMDVRMEPRSEQYQRCWSFRLTTSPQAEISNYRDAGNNTVHHFDIPHPHTRLVITAESLVELSPHPSLPESLPSTAWDELDSLGDDVEEAFDMLQPSPFAANSSALDQFIARLDIRRLGDPLTTVKMLNSTIFGAFAYAPQSTRVDSPIDDALHNRRGVCQDFAHIMIALCRRLGIPCRYVSGFLFHRIEDHDRSSEDATHAWVEALLPNLGWVGFDPTNNLIAADRHIRTAIGRDYADVPPTRGIFKGEAKTESELTVRVRVASSRSLDANDVTRSIAPGLGGSGLPRRRSPTVDQQQQQQQ